MSMESMVEGDSQKEKRLFSGTFVALAWVAGSIGLSVFLGMAHSQYEKEQRSISALSEIEFLRKTKREMEKPGDPIQRFIRVESLNEARKRATGDEIPTKDKAELNRILLALEGGE